MSANNNHDLSPKQRIAIQALATGADVTAAAEAGVHRTTVHHWCRTLPVFRAALRESSAQHADALRDQLRNMSNSAAAILREVLENKEAPQSLRLRAALAVIRAVEATHPDHDLPSTADYERFMCIGLEQGHATAALAHELPDQPPVPEATPRNAPCPCGSGAKYKRCCGAQAPAVLHHSTQFNTSAGDSV